MGLDQRLPPVELEPEVIAARPIAGGFHFELRVPPQLDCFSGHFPGLPLLPGVVQLNWAVQLAQPRFDLPPRFTHVSALKFMRVIEPGAALALELTYDNGRGEIRFSYRDAQGRECSCGRVGFAGHV